MIGEAYPAAAGLDLSHVIYTDAAGLVEGLITVPTYDGILPAYAARPDGAGPFSLVIVAEEIFGVHEHVHDVCRRLAKQGYAAVAPELLHRHGDPGQAGSVDAILHGIVGKVADDEVHRDLQAVLAHLREDEAAAVTATALRSSASAGAVVSPGWLRPSCPSFRWQWHGTG